MTDAINLSNCHHAMPRSEVIDGRFYWATGSFWLIQWFDVSVRRCGSVRFVGGIKVICFRSWRSPHSEAVRHRLRQGLSSDPISSPVKPVPHNQMSTLENAVACYPNPHSSIRWSLSASDKCRAQSSSRIKTSICLAPSCCSPPHAINITCEPFTYSSYRLPSLLLLSPCMQLFSLIQSKPF